MVTVDFSLAYIFGLLLVPTCLSLEFLSFTPVPEANTSSVIYLTIAKPTVTLDATSHTQRTIYLVQRHHQIHHTVSFHCQVNRQVTPLSELHLCSRSSQKETNQKCESMQLGVANVSISLPNGAQITYTSNVLTGATFIIRILDHGNRRQVLPVSCLFSCNVRSGGSHPVTITSNEVELRDVAFYFNNIPIDVGSSSEITKVKPMTLDRFPYTFECGDSNNHQTAVLELPVWLNEINSKYGPYEWGYCDVTATTMNAVACLNHFSPISSSIATSFFNGTLYLLNPTFISSGSKAIFCKRVSESTVVRTFAGESSHGEPPTIEKGLSLDTSSPEPALTHLEPLTATYVKYTMLVNSALEAFSLNAFYREPPGGVSFVWSKDGQRSSTSNTKYTFPLPRLVQEQMAGQYTLVVTSKSDTLTFTFDVEVLKPPTVLTPDCLPDLFYIMNGKSFTARCRFDVNRATSSAVTTLVGVDDLEATDTASLRNRLQTDPALVNRQLAKLHIGFQVSPAAGSLLLQDTKEVAIDIQDLQPGQDFKLSINLKSDIGNALVFSSLRVIPSPILITSPSESNCIEDCDRQSFNLSCALDPNLIQRWNSEFDVTPSITWRIQDRWSTSTDLNPTGIGQFVTIDPKDTSQITVWPQGKETAEGSLSLKRFISMTLGAEEPTQLTVRCIIQLLVNNTMASFEPPGERKTKSGDRYRAKRRLIYSTNRRSIMQGRSVPVASSSTGEPLYDSSWETDQGLKARLLATRVFTSDAKPVTANLSWIIPIVLGCIIVLVVVSLSLCLCTRKSGQIYMLYNKEREHGNDPIQEMKEKETFQTYQRQDEYPIASSRYSLNNGSMHVESEDDGELDQYEDGFNEEGSFIHGYKGDPTAFKSPLLPAISPSSGNTVGSSLRNQVQPFGAFRHSSQTPV